MLLVQQPDHLFFADEQDCARRDRRCGPDAERLTGQVLADFAAEDGGFYSTARGHEPLIVRHREGHDGATPAANAVAAHTLARLSYHLDRGDLRERAVEALRAWGKAVARQPRAFTTSLAAADLLLEIRDDGVINFGLGAGETVLGVSDTGLSNRAWKTVIHEDDHPMVEAMFDGLDGAARAGPVTVSGPSVPSTSSVPGTAHVSLPKPDQASAGAVSRVAVPAARSSAHAPAESSTKVRVDRDPPDSAPSPTSPEA